MAVACRIVAQAGDQSDDVIAIQNLADFYASGGLRAILVRSRFLSDTFEPLRLGSSKAMLAIGRIAARWICPSNKTPRSAIEWIKRAAHKRHGMLVLNWRAYTAWKGSLEKILPQRGICLRAAANAGHAPAMHRLGVMLSQPDAAQYDREAALRWLGEGSRQRGPRCSKA